MSALKMPSRLVETASRQHADNLELNRNVGQVELRKRPGHHDPHSFGVFRGAVTAPRLRLMGLPSSMDADIWKLYVSVAPIYRQDSLMSAESCMELTGICLCCYRAWHTFPVTSLCRDCLMEE